MSRRLLVIAQWQKDLDHWCRQHGLSRRHIKRVMGLQHAAGWRADDVAIVWLSNRGCDSDAFPYLNILGREGAPTFHATDIDGIKRWLEAGHYTPREAP